MAWQHDIDPVAFSIGQFTVRWYALTYLGGLLTGFFLMIHRIKAKLPGLSQEVIEWGLFWVILGIIAGARLGDVLFYQWYMWDSYLKDPVQILAIWRGGLSFHGGMAGLFIAGAVYCRINRIPFWVCADAASLAAPWGLMAGRLGNFLNGELFGRVSDLPWAVIFPAGGPLPRHPSQIYEALLEGPLLFLCLWLLRKKPRPGGVCGLFFMGYGLMRFIGEFFRQPDPNIGFLVGWLTNGQMLCLGQILAGVALLIITQTRKQGSSAHPGCSREPPT
jgi:phosphatidylglycerol:prolipoprotein diacylglycerol transferase